MDWGSALQYAGLSGLLGGGTDVKVQTSTSSTNVVSAPVSVQISSPGGPKIESPVNTPTTLTPTIYDEEKERGSYLPFVGAPSVPASSWEEKPETVEAGVMGGIPTWALLLGAAGVAAYLIWGK